MAKGKSVEDVPNASEDSRKVPKVSETLNGGLDNLEKAGAGENRIKELELKLRDAEIASRAKDMHIDRQNEERSWFFEKLNEASYKIGGLETRLLQLEGPRQERPAEDGDEVEDPETAESEEDEPEATNQD